jgi:Flp pilus assembly protein TadB
MEGRILEVVVVSIVVGMGVSIPISAIWMEHRTRTRALDVLRVYAERGDEPPASVLQALTGVSGRPHRLDLPTTKRQTRGGHLAHAAANAVFAIGLTGFAWWRVSLTGEAGTLVIVVVLAALFFAAGLAARLVGARYTPDER